MTNAPKKFLSAVGNTINTGSNGRGGESPASVDYIFPVMTPMRSGGRFAPSALSV
jgi:hypothetical protein